VLRIELAEWFDIGDRHTLSIRRFMDGTAADKAPECQLEATDFLCLRNNKMLNDNVMNAALNTLCLRSNNRGTCNVLAWWSHICPMHACIDKAWKNGAQQIVTAICYEYHWVGVFFDIIDTSSGTVTIYNSLGANHTGFTYAHTAVRAVLSSLG
jgi:Ulp1 family protease